MLDHAEDSAQIDEIPDTLAEPDVTSSPESIPGPYPLLQHLKSPQLLAGLLPYLSFREVLPLLSLTAASRKALEANRDLKEEILERYLSASVGYIRWNAERMGEHTEPLSLTLRVSKYFSRIGFRHRSNFVSTTGPKFIYERDFYAATLLLRCRRHFLDLHG
jgi:hypothetical protein